MMRHGMVVAALTTLAAVPAAAQSPQCPSGTAAALIVQDACQQAVDLFQYMAPQLGTAITGGNAILGQGGTLGGLGHFSVGARVNVVAGSIPQVQDVPPRPTGATSQSFPTNDSPIPMPAIDGAIGLFKGIPLALTNVGGLDLLLSATYVPKVDRDNVTITPDHPLQLGYGVRVGALQESLIVPGVSFTILKRDLPTLKMTGTSTAVTGPVTLDVSDASVKTTAWRVVASKSLILFGVALGVGQDMYKSHATASATTAGQTSSAVRLSQSMTRTSGFFDVSVNLPLLKLVGEIGQASGGTAPATVNTFDGKGIVDSRLYGSIGLRFGF
jgi:hypothetical protein